MAKSKKEIAEAKKQISEYFRKAADAFKKGPESKEADRYVAKARRLAMKYKIRLTSAQKRRFCKHCYSFLMPGVNARVRTKDGRVVYYCLVCRKYTKIPYQ